MATEDIVVKVSLDDKLSNQTKSMSDRFTQSLSNLKTSTVAAGAAFVAFGAVVWKGIEAFAESEKVSLQLEARLKSTGGVVGYTADQLKKMASSLSEVTGETDEAIVSMQTMLISFDRIRGEAFYKTQQAALDLSAALGQDLKTSAQTLGRALQEPERGVQLLRRAGINFTESQKSMIEQMVETNNIAGAQDIILKELEKRFGGAAEAAGKGLSGSLKRLGNAWDELLESMGRVVTNDGKSGGVIDWAISVIKWMDEMVQKVPYWAQKFFAGADFLFILLKHNWNIVTEHFKYAWETMLEYLKVGLRKFIDFHVAILDYIPGMKQVADYWREVSTNLAGTTTAAQAHENRLKALNDEHARELRVLSLTNEQLDQNEQKRLAIADVPVKPEDNTATPYVDPSKGGHREGAILLAEQFRALQESTYSELELEGMKYESKLLLLKSYYGQEYETDAEAKRIRETLELEHQARLGNATAQGILARRDFERKTQTEQTKFVLDNLAGMLSGVSNYNKTFFALSKAANIAQAIMNTYRGASNALAAYPPPLSLVMAAAVVATGFAQVAQIKNQNYGGAAHGGLDYVPSEQTYLLNKGERVLSPNQNKDLTDYLDQGGGNGISVGAVNINVAVADAKGLMAMDKSDWQKVVSEGVIPALNSLDKIGIRQDALSRLRT